MSAPEGVRRHAVGESRHRIPGASVGQPTEPFLGGAIMWPDQRLVELFEIEHPIVLAPMAGFGTIGLAASVCEAGGLGSISCATMQAGFAAAIIQGLCGP